MSSETNFAREAIILAAGHGSRLRERARSKPLARIGHATLIEIALRQAIAAGAARVIVVTGHQGAAVEHELEVLGRRCKAEIVPVRLADWNRPNGWSVLAGAERAEGPFLLMMADHVFADGLLPVIARTPMADADAVLGIDRPENPLIDPEDATWVALGSKARIRRIGKTVMPRDSVDCGAFLAGDGLTDAIREAIAAGRPGSLSDGMQVLADRGRARTVDIAGRWWIDVDDPRAHDIALEQAARHIAYLRAGCRPRSERAAHAG